MEIRTLAAATKASFHKRLANVAFAHSLNSGVGVHESKVGRCGGGSLCWVEAASWSLSGAERYLWCNLWRSFERRATKLDEHKLTRNPCDEGSAHITLFIKRIYDFEKKFVCIIRATRCIQGVAQALLNRDVEIIKFPFGYLSDSVSDFDTLEYTH